MKRLLFFCFLLSAFCLSAVSQEFMQNRRKAFQPSVSASTLNNGIVVYWKLDETSGNRSDSVGSNTLIDSNTVSYVSGKVSNAASFDDTASESLFTPSTSDLSLQSDEDFTWSLWIAPQTGIDADVGILVKGSGSIANCEYLFRAVGASIRFYVGNGSTSTDARTNALSTGSWTHIIAWHDKTANTLNIQANGGGVISASWSSGTQTTSYTFRLGCSYTGTAYFTGYLDEVGFWKRILTADERAELYNGGTGKTYPF